MKPRSRAVGQLDAAGFDRNVAAALHLDVQLLMTHVDSADGLARSPGTAQVTESRRSPDDLIATSPSSAPMPMDKTPATQSIVNRRIGKP